MIEPWLRDDVGVSDELLATASVCERKESGSKALVFIAETETKFNDHQSIRQQVTSSEERPHLRDDDAHIRGDR